MPSPSITVKQAATWSNWHSTGGVGGKVGKLFIPFNDWDDGSAPPPGQPFAPGLAGLKSIVQQAEASGARVRALGSSWSLNNIAFVEDYLVDTSNLSALIIGFSQGYVEPGFQGGEQSLVLAQCGVTVSALNNGLASWNPPLALPTSGASNGANIAEPYRLHDGSASSAGLNPGLCARAPHRGRGRQGLLDRARLPTGDESGLRELARRDPYP